MAVTEYILEKIKYYCAYQERSHKDVRTKLIELEVYGEDLENYIITLISENYLNEERFACTLARGKFYFKKWGRNKIKQALKMHQISDYCIKKAMKEIDEDDYQKTFDDLAQKKLLEVKTTSNKFAKMAKVKNFLMQRGFENEYIHHFIKNNF